MSWQAEGGSGIIRPSDWLRHHAPQPIGCFSGSNSAATPSGLPHTRPWAEAKNQQQHCFLRLHELLELQGDERGISADEMHFIIVHQTFELWFKQIIRELSETREILDQVPVPEDDIPRAVSHLERTTEFRLMANQWTVLETLTHRDS